MKQPENRLRSKVIISLVILGLAVFIVYLYFFVNPAQVMAVLSQTNTALYAWSFVAYSLSALFSSLVWHRLLNNLAVKISARKALLFTWVGLFFDATVPQLGWSAEISRTYLLSKESKIDAAKIAASVVGQKIFSMTQTIAALTIGLASVLLSYELPFLVTFLIALVLALSVLALTVVCYVSIRPVATKKLLNWTLRLVLFFRRKWNPQNFQLKAEESLSRFHEGIAQLKENPVKLVQPIVFSALSFVLEISVVFLTFIAIGFTVPVDKVLIVYTLTGTLQTLGVTLFGFPEVIMTASFTALGIPVSISFSVTLLTRIVTLWFKLLISYTALHWAGIAILRKSKVTQI